MNTKKPLLDTQTMQRIGGQLGSNPAGIYQDNSGQQYYVKELESLAHARNEFIAAQLYRLAGAPTLTYVPTLSANRLRPNGLSLIRSALLT